MPWLTIITMLLSFFATKANGASNTKALVTAGLAGAGTYAITHETDWGKANLGSLDGVDASTAGAARISSEDDQPVKDAAGNVITVPSDGKGSVVADVLKSWGGVGSAAVLGVGATAAGGGIFSKENLPLLLGGGLILLFLLKG